MKATTWLIHAISRAALELPSPLRTKRVMKLVGRLFPAIDADEALLQIEQLERAKRGTCLSRALSVAVRVSGASVVIGVSKDPANSGGGTTAHAWIEVNGAPLRDEPVRTLEIARL